MELDITETPKWRVKLYELEHTGMWVDHGIGYATIEMDSELNGPALCVISESEPGKYLMKSKIQSEDLYERQGTIILWKEADFSGTIDYALSFQDPEGCGFIWNNINEVQGQYLQQREYGNIPSFSRSHRISQAGDANESSTCTILDESDSASTYNILPVDYEMEDWLSHLKVKLTSLNPSQREYVIAQLLHDECKYFIALFDKFSQCEKDDNLEALRLLADIFRLILLLNDSSLVEYLLVQDEVFVNVAGIFEYDRTLRVNGDYRRFLFENARMKNVIKLSEDLVLACKFLFRLKYVRDIMLHPTIDDPGITAINSMITFTSCEISSQIMREKQYIAEVFYRISPKFQHSIFVKFEEGNVSRSIDAILFLKELFVLSKFMAFEKRYELYRQLFEDFSSLFVDVVNFLIYGGCRALFVGPAVYGSVSRTSNINTQNILSSGTAGTDTPSTIIDNMDRSYSLRSDTSEDAINVLYSQNEPQPSDDARKLSPVKCSSFEELFTFNDAMEMLQAVGEILSAVAYTYPSVLRQGIISGSHPAWNPLHATGNTSNTQQLKWEENCLMFGLIFCIIHGHDVISIELFGEVLKTLLDFEKVTLNAKNEKEKFLPLFYDHYLPWLLLPFLEEHNPTQTIPYAYYFSRVNFRNLDDGIDLWNTYRNSALTFSFEQTGFMISTSRRVILDTVIYCITYHSYRLKYFILRGNILTKILQKSFPKIKLSDNLNSCGCKSYRYLQLYAMKLLKSIVSTKDDFYYRHIEKMDSFSYLFSFFFQELSSTKAFSPADNKSVCLLKDNVLTSCFYELIDFIVKENINILVSYLYKRYHELFSKAEFNIYVECFDKLTLKYEQIIDRQDEGQQQKSLVAGGSIIGRSGWLSSSSMNFNRKDNLRLHESDAEDGYFFGNEEITDHLLDEGIVKRRKSDDGKFLPVLSSPSSSPLPSAQKMHTHMSTKPSSPPHYSQRKHGNPLDGELTISNNGVAHSRLENASVCKQSDLFSLLADYVDDDTIAENSSSSEILFKIQSSENECEVDDFLPLPTRSHTDDEDDTVAAVFGGKGVSASGMQKDKFISVRTSDDETRVAPRSNTNTNSIIGRSSSSGRWENVEPAETESLVDKDMAGVEIGNKQSFVTLVLKRKQPILKSNLH